MGIDFKINITRKIKVNGKEYGSPEEVPEQFRQTVKDALGQAGAGGINFNGVTYAGPEAMPPEVRRVYEQALEKAGAEAARSGQQLELPQRQPKPEGALTGRTLAIILILLAAAALLFISR